MAAPANTTPSFADVLEAVRHSHDRLATAVTPLTDDALSGRSYCDDWSIAQVASHLGSGAEIFGLFLRAGLGDGPAPGAEQFQPIWETWNAKTAPQQVRDALAADARFLDQLAALAPGEQERWRLDMFGAEQSLTGMLRMRLAEHGVHTWDIAVALDPAATVAADVTELIIDNLPALVERAGKGVPEALTIGVSTTRPGREFLLELRTDRARLAPASGAVGTATMRLPGEAFVRLLYGRLDPDHTPASVEADGVELATLRRAFPGI